LTDARLKACRCPRISYIWGCVCLANSANLVAEKKWNADATTIIVSESGAGSLVCIIKDADNVEPVSSSSLPDNLNLLVKWFAFNNAGGEVGPLVLMIAVPSMEDDTYFATQVLSMGSTSAIGEKGWLYFSKTRGGCPAMWNHNYLNVTIPTIRFATNTRYLVLNVIFLQHFLLVKKFYFKQTNINIAEHQWIYHEKLLQPRRRGGNPYPRYDRGGSGCVHGGQHGLCQRPSFSYRNPPSQRS
jgi:hypothetical protein